MLLRKPHTKTALIFNALRRQYMPSSITCVALPRVVARGRAHPPPCRYVGTYDHRAEPAKVEAAERTTYTEWSVMVEPRQHIVPPHMLQARLVRLPDGCSCVGTAAAPAVRGQGSSPPTPVEMAADVAISTARLVTERWSRTPSSACGARVLLDFSTAYLLAMRCKPVGTGLALHQPTRSSP